MRSGRTTRVRIWRRLLLAGLACLLTSRAGLVQSPVIVNGGSARIGPPVTPAEPGASVLEFTPRNSPGSGLPISQVVTLPSSASPSVLNFDPAPSGESETLLFDSASPASNRQEIMFSWLPAPRFADAPRLPADSPLVPMQTREPPLALASAFCPAPKKAARASRVFPTMPGTVPSGTMKLAVAQHVDVVRVSFNRPRGIVKAVPAFAGAIGLECPAIPDWSGASARLVAPVTEEVETYAAFGVPALAPLPWR